jgi:type IV secretory pathway VirB10-like protein
VSGASDVPGALPPKQDPESLVLRGRPRPVVRFRRGVIVGAAGAAGAALIALSWTALEPPSLPKLASPIEGDEPAGKAAPEALADAPGSYGDVPRLGPPLPGDLGRPIVEQQKEIAGLGDAGPFAAPLSNDSVQAQADANRQRLESARQAALSSPLLADLGSTHKADEGAGGESSGSASAQGSASAGGATFPPGDQGAAVSSAGEASGRLQPSPSPWTLSAGTIIPASLITGLSSDLAGTVFAQVTHDVSDSATGRTVLVPQGARLVGSYDSAVSYGQRRALLVWKSIVFPDGSSVRLDNLPASDAAGYTGLSDRVNSHSWQLLKGIALSTLFGVGTQLSLGSSGSGLVRAIRESGEHNAADAGEQITGRNIQIRPTITIRPGWPVRAVVNHDLVLKPWRG